MYYLIIVMVLKIETCVTRKEIFIATMQSTRMSNAMCFPWNVVSAA